MSFEFQPKCCSRSITLSIDRESDRPSHIHPHHWHELTVGSAILPEIASLNFRSLSGDGIIEWLAGDELAQLGSHSSQYVTAPVKRIFERYQSVITGGWGFSGLDPLRRFGPMEWGCFKPDSPRLSQDGKPVKYEHPAKTQTQLFIPRPSRNVGLKIAHRHGLESAYRTRIPDLKLDTWDEGFFSWWLSLDPDIAPVVITEGAKKSASLLSQGCVAVGIPGVCQWNIPKTRELIPELEVFAAAGRTVRICLDADTKRSARRTVERETAKLGAALRRYGCKVEVMSWDPKLGKGIDDVIASHGSEAVEAIYTSAIRFECWALRKQSALTLKPNWVAPDGVKYLESDLEADWFDEEPRLIPFPKTAKLLAMKAPKGTGKTTVIKRLVAEAHAKGQPVLFVSHREQLTQALCDRVGVLSIYDVKDASQQNREQAQADVLAHGMGLCIASLHPNSQAHFRAADWENALIIIDETEQVIWEMLNSSTCRKNRIAIIREFRSLMEAVLSPESEGRVILADADLSDYSVNFIRGIGQQPHLEPWLALSHWQAGGYDCRSYERPEDLLMQVEAAIEREEKALIMTDSQRAKSGFSTTALSARWQQMYLNKRILVLDSKTLHRKDHPAYGAIANGKLEQLLSQYDIVICSPSVETGISIDLKGHFDAVYGFYAGVLSENSIRQSLLRLRERVPRHIYIAPHGLETIGGGETWYKALAETQEKCARATLNLLYEAGCDDIESNLSQAATVAWAKMAARHNTGSAALRECVLQGLRDEGHRVSEVTGTDDDARQELKAELKAEKHNRLRERAQAVCEATSVDTSELEALEQSRSVESLAQELALQKAQLQKRYQLEAITPDLYILDQVGYGAKLRLHYYLTVGREYLKNRDRAKVNELLKNSDGAIWAPDVNRATLITKIATYEYFNVLDILDLDELSEHTPQVRALGEAVQGQLANIRVASGINLYGTTKPDGSIDYIEIVRRFLKPLGFNLPLCRREGPRGEQVRIYQLEQVDYKTFKLEGEAVTYQVNRHEIYQRWLEKDAIAEKQPETPVIERTEAVVSDKSVVSQGNKKSLISSGDYQTKPPPASFEERQIETSLSQIESICLEILQTCDCWGQYLSVQATVGMQRLRALWKRLSNQQRHRITLMQPEVIPSDRVKPEPKKLVCRRSSTAAQNNMYRFCIA